MPTKPVSPRSANQIDLIIAERLRRRRTELGVSQAALAELVGVTFQQIQKYEKGANRIAASRLFAIARVLEVPLTFFFEPVKDAPRSAKAKKRGAAKAGRPASGRS